MGAGLAGQVCWYITAQICNQVIHVTNQHVLDHAAYSEPAPHAGGSGTVRVIILALDYKATKNPLTCSIDGRNMEKLVRNCGIPDSNIVAMYDEQCTKQNVSNLVRQVGSQCTAGDYFVFYYSGHGTNLADQSGDEADGQDEAFCFVTPDGQVNYSSCMSDDDFSDLVTEVLDPGVNVLVLTDCCHSGTICDFGNGHWAGRKAVSITGCLDNQTSGDIGKGGIFTHSMLLALGALKEEGDSDFAVAKLYNKTIEEDEEVFNSEQDITLQSAPGFTPNHMAWPLMPQGGWQPPLRQRSLS